MTVFETDEKILYLTRAELLVVYMRLSFVGKYEGSCIFLENNVEVSIRGGYYS
jgi:hypothetical protein